MVGALMSILGVRRGGALTLKSTGSAVLPTA
jgi:hypothetical protein